MCHARRLTHIITLVAVWALLNTYLLTSWLLDPAMPTTRRTRAALLVPATLVASLPATWSSWPLAQPDPSGNSFGNKGFVTLGFRKYLCGIAYASQKVAIALDRNKLSVGIDHIFQKSQLEIWPLCRKHVSRNLGWKYHAGRNALYVDPALNRVTAEQSLGPGHVGECATSAGGPWKRWPTWDAKQKHDMSRRSQ